MKRDSHRLDVPRRRRAGRPGRALVALGPVVAVTLAALLVVLPAQGGGRRRLPAPAPRVERDAPQPAAGDFVQTKSGRGMVARSEAQPGIKDDDRLAFAGTAFYPAWLDEQVRADDERLEMPFP